MVALVTRLRVLPVEVDGERVNVLVVDRTARPGVERGSGMDEALRREIEQGARDCPVLAGALVFRDEVELPDVDGGGEPPGVAVVPSEHPGAMFEPFIRAAPGSTVISPEMAPLVEEVVTAAREFAARMAGGGWSEARSARLTTAVRALDERFPHARWRPTEGSADGSDDHG